MRTLLLILLIIPLQGLAHDKSDVVTMYNGDRITGEILGLINGNLKINPRYSPTITLDLQHIAKVESDYNYEILTAENERLYGNISSTEKNGELLFTSIEDAKVVQLLGITEIRPVEESFGDRLNYTLGANFTFEPDLLTYKLEGTVTYANRKGQYSARANYLESTTRSYDQETDSFVDGDPTVAALVSLENEVWTDLKGQRFRSLSAQYDYNDQLNNFGRVSLGAGIGRYWLDSAGVRFATTVGLQGVAEKTKIGAPIGPVLPFCLNDPSGADCGDDSISKDTLYSAEAFASANLIMYSLTDMDLDLNVLGSLYPSLTEDDRVRAHLEASLSWEVVSDLFVKLSWYSDFDSGDRNEEGLAPTTTRRLDYNILLGVDWRP